MKKRSIWLSLLLIVGMMLCFSTVHAEGKVYKFRFAQITPATHPYYSAISQPWAEEIKKRTAGKVEITLYPAGTLAGGEVMYSSIVDGITDIGTSSFGWERGRHPVMDAFVYAPGFPSAKVAGRIANEVAGKFRLKELSDAHLLFIHTCAPMHMWTKTPVHTLEDMKGMEIRAGGPTGKLVQLIGGIPVSAPQSQAYEMLSKGIVKGSISSLDVLKGFRQAEVVKHVTLAYFHVAPFFVSMNLDKWNALPPEIQKVFDEVSKEYIDIAGNVWDKASEAGLKYAEEEGLEIYTLPPEERARWHAAYKPLKEEYIKSMEEKGLPGKAFLEEIENFIKKYQ
ncbi:MAG: TRAP transporter substrate-binding protein [Deltaproteobacteria bacterium]|nr:TRAP transporter substrate-binding protein [Deltaproteobacteria bacterium]